MGHAVSWGKYKMQLCCHSKLINIWLLGKHEWLSRNAKNQFYRQIKRNNSRVGSKAAFNTAKLSPIGRITSEYDVGWVLQLYILPHYFCNSDFKSSSALRDGMKNSL